MIVVDTNVVVSGLLTSNPKAPAARIVDNMVAGQIRFMMSPELLDEYRTVLLRPTLPNCTDWIRQALMCF